MNNKRNLLIMIIAFSLILVIGSSYAYLVYTKESSNNYVINVGTLEVTFVDSETQFLNLTNMYPMTDEEGKEVTKELVFQVKNTGNVDSYYDVSIEEVSTNPEFKSVIKYIVNKDNDGYKEPKILGSDKYIEIGGFLKPNGTADYHVKVWLANFANNTYMNKEFKAKVVVNSFQKSDYAKDVIKSKLVKYEESSKDTFTGGLVAINTDGELYNETDENQEIREYRYSGPSVNNYVTFNGETWRIIGVFREDNEEFVKIVRDEYLKSNMFPLNYNLNNLTYVIKSEELDDAVFWNGTKWNSQDFPNRASWSKNGLMYYLNTEKDDLDNKGYQSYLNASAKNMIRETIYYLGNTTFILSSSYGYGLDDTAIEAYQNERNDIICSSEIIQNSQDSNCYVWYNNDPTWKGKVALMYPSDVAYSINPNNWTTFKLLSKQKTNSSWIYTTFKEPVEQFYWLISPMSDSNFYASAYRKMDDGIFIDRHNPNNINDKSLVHPTLHLKSNVKINGGDGSQDNAYQLSLD